MIYMFNNIIVVLFIVALVAAYAAPSFKEKKEEALVRGSYEGSIRRTAAVNSIDRKVMKADIEEMYALPLREAGDFTKRVCKLYEQIARKREKEERAKDKW